MNCIKKHFLKDSKYTLMIDNDIMYLKNVNTLLILCSQLIEPNILWSYPCKPQFVGKLILQENY